LFGVAGWVVPLAAGLVAVATVSGWLTGKPQAQPFTEPVAIGSIEEIVLANGVLEASRMVNVGAQVSGQLKSLHVNLGEAIKAGDLIAEIDSTPQANALRIAEAALANIKAQRKARGIQLHQSEQAFRRQKLLSGQRAVAAADLETAEATFRGLEADVESLEAQIAQASVEVENARANLGYTRIVAPMDGVVVAVVTKAGQTLNSSQATPTIVVLAKLDVMTVKVQISEADISRVRPGQKVWFTTMGEKGTRTAAVLDRIDPAPTSIAAETAATALVPPAVYYNGLFETPNADGRLRPMMSVVVSYVSKDDFTSREVSWKGRAARPRHTLDAFSTETAENGSCSGSLAGTSNERSCPHRGG
jgi:macrolide-specific efflux system membrane fusion protein